MRQTRFSLRILASTMLAITACAGAISPVQAQSSTDKEVAPQTIRQHATFTLKCSKDKVQVRELGKDGKYVHIEASGCDRSVRYAIPVVKVTPKRPCECDCRCLGWRCTRYCPVDPGSPGGGVTCCEYDCVEWVCPPCCAP